MKRHWKGISKGVGKISVCRLLYVVGCIFLMCCTPKNDSETSTSEKTVPEYDSDRVELMKEKETSGYQPSGFHYDNNLKTTNAEDEYNDRLDDYLDDPEDELRFDPEIFDFQDE